MLSEDCLAAAATGKSGSLSQTRRSAGASCQVAVQVTCLKASTAALILQIYGC